MHHVVVTSRWSRLGTRLVLALLVAAAAWVTLGAWAMRYWLSDQVRVRELAVLEELVAQRVSRESLVFDQAGRNMDLLEDEVARALKEGAPEGGESAGVMARDPD